MRTIIAGGRDYQMTPDDWRFLDTVGITEVVCGEARGADTGGKNWAKARCLPVKSFPADWDRYKKRAGYLRNAQMAQYAEAVVLFPGGNGTANMREEAIKVGIKVIEAPTTKDESHGAGREEA